jgi:hypothetical protein
MQCREDGRVTVFYRGRGARITHELFQSGHPESEHVDAQVAAVRSYEIKAIRNVRIVERNGGPAAMGVSTVRFAYLVVGTGAGVVAVVGRSLLDMSSLSVVALALLVVTIVLWVRYSRAHRRCFELWCDYHGRVVRIYQTTDTRIFGQVRRGLIRAIEHRSKAV